MSEREGGSDSESFFEEEEEEEQSEQTRQIAEEGGRRRSSPQSPPFEVDDSWADNNRDSFVTALENPSDLSSPPPDNEDGVGVMSTIEEESRSYETSTGASVSRRVQEEEERDRRNQYQEDFDESQELRDLQQLVKETADELRQDDRLYSHPPSTQVPAASSQDQNESVPKDDEGLEALLRKLERLESAQNVLEDVLNTGVSDNIDIDAFIAQLPLDNAQLLASSRKDKDSNLGDDDPDPSQRSFSSEIASIQKIIDGGDLSVSINSEVAGGNNNMLSSCSETNAKEENISGERSVDDVLKEYEDFERSLSRASVVDESFRSDISSVPPMSSYSNQNQAGEKTVPITLPYSGPAHQTQPVPVIKPPVLKSVVPPPSNTGTTTTTAASSGSAMSSSGKSAQAQAQAREDYYQSSEKAASQSHPEQESEGSSSRTRPMTSNANVKYAGSRSSRLESSQSAIGFKAQSGSASHSQSARTAASVTTASSNKEVNQDAFKPRNRRMRSPRTVASPRQPNEGFGAGDIPTSCSSKGGGEGYHQQQQVSKKDKDKGSSHSQQKPGRVVENVEAVVAAEALKTIEKLNTMVARQETLLEAYSKDNEKLWDQLRDSQTEAQEKESKFQDVINSLKTEVAALKLKRLVNAPAIIPPPSPSSTKAELQRSREESELKSQQLLELRKEVLQLQNKLATRARSPPKSKQPSAAQLQLQEREKEYQKTITGLSKQVRTLQRILYSKDETAPPPPPATSDGSGSNKVKPMQRTKSDIVKHNAANVRNVQQRANLRNTGVDMSQMVGKKLGASPNKSVNINTGEILQASLNCLEQEREEFESIIADKNKLIFEKEKTIIHLREQVETMKSQLPEGDVVEPGLVDELRSRIITQNKVIQTLKEHLSTFKKIEVENLLLREEKSNLEQQTLHMRRKLEFAHSLVKPENEVLCLLSEKVDELNSRYHQRERQLDSLLSRLTVKTTTGGGGALLGPLSSSSSNDSEEGGGVSSACLHSHSNLSPRRRLALGQFSNNNGSLGGPLLTSSSSVGGKGRSSTLISADILHMVDLSPSNSFQLYNTESDLPEA